MPPSVTTNDVLNGLNVLQKLPATLGPVGMKCAALAFPTEYNKAPDILGARMMCALAVIDEDLAALQSIRQQLLSIIEEKIE